MENRGTQRVFRFFCNNRDVNSLYFKIFRMFAPLYEQNEEQMNDLFADSDRSARSCTRRSK